MSDTLGTLECVLNSYRKAGLTGTSLRMRMTRAATKFETTGEMPSKLVDVDDERLRNEDGCAKYHINGVTFFRTVKEAKKSPLYLAAADLGIKSPPKQLVEARRKKGQGAEQWKERVATGRVERTPTHQAKQRREIQSKQAKQWAELEKQFAKKR